MSRTFRKIPHFQTKHLPEFYSGKKLDREFHKAIGDKESGCRNAPKHFRKTLNRIHRRKNKRRLDNALRLETDMIRVPDKKNANWFWW